MHASLPDELTLHVFGFCSAKCLLTVEAASRALRDLRRHKTNDGLWCGLLRAMAARGPGVVLAPAAGDRAAALPSVRHEAGRADANYAATGARGRDERRVRAPLQMS